MAFGRTSAGDEWVQLSSALSRRHQTGVYRSGTLTSVYSSGTVETCPGHKHKCSVFPVIFKKKKKLHFRFLTRFIWILSVLPVYHCIVFERYWDRKPNTRHHTTREAQQNQTNPRQEPRSCRMAAGFVTVFGTWLTVGCRNKNHRIH